MGLLAQRDVAAAVEAARVIGGLLANPNEPNRIERAQHALGCARAAAKATKATAEVLKTESSIIDAHSANSAAILAEQLFTLF